MQVSAAVDSLTKAPGADSKRQTQAAKQAILRADLAAQHAEVVHRTAAEAKVEAAFVAEQARDVRRFMEKEIIRKAQEAEVIDKLKVYSY